MLKSRAQPFQWDYVDEYAQSLRSNEPVGPDDLVEAHRRCVCGRVYYGTFHQVRQWMGLEGLRRQVHAAIVNDAPRAIVAFMGQLQDIREKSDYTDTCVINSSDVQNTFHLADRISRHITKQRFR